MNGVLNIVCKSINRSCGIPNRMALHKKQLLPLLVAFGLLFSATVGSAKFSFGSPAYVPWVWHNIGAYIRADGTVDPPDAPIQRSGNTYTLKNDLFASLAIQRNDSVLDGNGFKFYGGYYGTGILLQNANNVLVKNVNIQYFGQGIYFDNCNNSMIRNSKLAGNGIVGYMSSNNSLLDNDVSGEISMNYGDNQVITGNNASSVSISWSGNVTIKSNHIFDLKLGNSTLAIGNYTEGLYLDNVKDSKIAGNLVENKNVGVDIWEGVNLDFSNNQLKNNQVGFKLWGQNLEQNILNIDTTNTVNGKPIYYLVNKTDYRVPTNAGWIFAINGKNITVQNWVSEPNWDAIVFINTQDSQITGCTLQGNYNAIHIEKSTNININRNKIANNSFSAFFLEGTTYSNIMENDVTENYYLFDLWHDSTNNTIVQNNFFGNPVGLFENGTKNSWDNGSEGNYWSSFTGVDFNHDGISDYPYVIDSLSGETDRYPLMNPLRGKALPQIQSSNGSILAMPEEYINYTLTYSNGALWAKIDGVYPMHLSQSGINSLPMVYPIPPNTTNIHIYLQGTEVTWTNYSTVDPIARHQTAIGNWSMIYAQLGDVPSDFLLEIHYEHPVQIINGSYTFLYDLNISPYLSETSATSTAHFKVTMPQNYSDISVFRTGLNNTDWNAMNYTISNNSSPMSISFDVISEYNKPLLGDIAFVLGKTIPEFSTWVLLSLIVSLTIIAVIFAKKRNQRNPSQISP